MIFKNIDAIKWVSTHILYYVNKRILFGKIYICHCWSENNLLSLPINELFLWIIWSNLGSETWYPTQVMCKCRWRWESASVFKRQQEESPWQRPQVSPAGHVEPSSCLFPVPPTEVSQCTVCQDAGLISGKGKTWSHLDQVEEPSAQVGVRGGEGANWKTCRCLIARQKFKSRTPFLWALLCFKVTTVGAANTECIRQPQH